MKQLIKQCFCMILAMCMFVSTMIFDIQIVNAADKEFVISPPSQDDKFYVSYDSSKYQIFWVSRTKVTLNSQYGSWWWNLDIDTGDKLGTATLRVYYLEPKQPAEGLYYAMAGCQISMDPVNVSGSVSGMSQLAKIMIKTPNEASRVCSPTSELLNIQASNSTNSSTSFTAGTGLKYNSGNKSWEASGEISFGKTWGSSSTYTYNKTNVNLTQKNKDGEYASWCYDYKAKDGDETWNAYLMSSSKVAGQVVYRLNAKPTYKNRRDNIPTKVACDIEFGAGDLYTGEVAERMWTTTRELAIVRGYIGLSY